ncbi:MAG: DoxX family protein [Gemmatimonadaceae bacterium]
MNRSQHVVRILFALGIMSVGVLALVYGYSILVFMPPPTAWIVWLRPVGLVSGVLMLGSGAGLLFQRTASVSSRILTPFLLLWALTRLPVVVADPLREITWFAVGEVGALAAAALVLFVRFAELKPGSRLQAITAEHGATIARILLGYSVVTFGLSHFFEFAARTVSLVPPWLPYRTAWADLTGAAQIAAGLGALFAVYPRWSAALEAALLSVFTVLVWVPAVIGNPAKQSNWVEFLLTFALAGACWVVAEGTPARA